MYPLTTTLLRYFDNWEPWMSEICDMVSYRLCWKRIPSIWF